MADPACSHPRVSSGHVGSGEELEVLAWSRRPARSLGPAPARGTGTGGGPVQSMLRCALSHLQGLLLTLQGQAGLRSPREIRGPASLSQPRIWAQSASPVPTLCPPRTPRGTPLHSVHPAGRAVLQTPPARSHLLPAIHSPASCPPMTTGRPALYSSWSLLRALSTGVCLWGWGEPEPTWRMGSVRKRGRDSPRCPEQGLGRGWAATRGREGHALPSPPAAAWSPPVPRAARFTQPENGIPLLPSSAAGGNQRGAGRTAAPGSPG